jgi:translation initiation factor 2 beta subunit (eIF-2beta)/eIF-5
VIEPLGKAVAYDINEKNATSSDGKRYDLSRVANIKHQYSRIRASIAENTHNDRRKKQKLLSKYGEGKRQGAFKHCIKFLKRLLKTL